MSDGNIIFYDTETTGLVNNRAPHTDPSQPHLVQLALILTTRQGGPLATVELIIRPDGYVIPDAAARVHGITTEVAIACGVPLALAVATWTNLRALATETVAHNARFDELVMAAALHRTGRASSLPAPTVSTCTMELASPIMDLPPTEKMRRAGYLKNKPPNLTECVGFFFKEGLPNAHSALADAEACARVYFEIRRRQAAAADATATQGAPT